MGVHVRRRLQLHAPPIAHFFPQPLLPPLASIPASKIRHQKCRMRNKFDFFTESVIEIRLCRGAIDTFLPFFPFASTGRCDTICPLQLKLSVVDNRLSIHIGIDDQWEMWTEGDKKKRLKLRNIVEVTVWKIGCTRMKTCRATDRPISNAVRCAKRNEAKGCEQKSDAMSQRQKTKQEFVSLELLPTHNRLKCDFFSFFFFSRSVFFCAF